MLASLSIRDVVLVEALDLEIGPGLTVLTGETGAGKSIILDALGLALGGRGDAGLVRAGARQATATAVFAAPDDPEILEMLAERGFETVPGDDLILRRTLSADGRSRAWINDQPAGVTALREIGSRLVEVHGQHETVGLLDPRNHRGMLDAHGGLCAERRTTAAAFDRMKAAEAELANLRRAAAEAAARAEDLRESLAELDRLDPRAGEEADLAEERALLGAAEKALSDLTSAREALGGDALSQRLAQAFRDVEHARTRAVQSGAGEDHPVIARLSAAGDAIDRALVEATEAVAAVDAAAEAFEFEPGRLDKAEERLFALRAAARKLNVAVETLPEQRDRFRAQLRLIEDGAEALEQAQAEADAARTAYETAAGVLSRARHGAASSLGEAVQRELTPLKLERARFCVSVEPLAPERAGREGADTVRFEIATNAGASYGPLDAIASGGELARFALAMKASMAGGGEAAQPVMIFDEVDQGVGGAVAEAVGLRLKALAGGGQVLVVTHSPQVAAKGHVHWRVRKGDVDGQTRSWVETLSEDARREEIARMLAGAEITDAARAAARELIG